MKKFAIEIDLNARGVAHYGAQFIYHKIEVENEMFAFADIHDTVFTKYDLELVYCVNVYSISGKKFIGRVYAGRTVERPNVCNAYFTIDKYILDRAEWIGEVVKA